jgi:hypothetical protein
MDDNSNSVDGRPMHWIENPMSPDEYQHAAAPANPRSWPHHEQGQTFNLQGAPHSTEMFDRDTHPASQEGNLEGSDATFYNDGSQHNPMSENGYAPGNISGVGEIHRNVQGFASNQE